MLRQTLNLNDKHLNASLSNASDANLKTLNI